jgi:Flp pilus assembly protein TadG
MKMMSSIWLRAKQSTAAFIADCRAVAAVELAVIAPLMLLMFFATVEFSTGVAANRKVTLVAHTLADLTSRSTTVTDTDLTNFFAAGTGIMYPYPASPIRSTISELYVDPTTLVARVQWSSGAAPRALKSTMTIPAALKVAGSYLIYSEVSYTFTPAVPWILQGGITLSDYAYTRPRQSACVMYNATVCTTL